MAEVPEEEVWLAGLKSERTRRAYRVDVGDFVATLGIRSRDELHQIRPAVVIHWQRTLEDKGLKPRTFAGSSVPPTDSDIEKVLQKIRNRILALLRKRGLLDDQGFIDSHRFEEDSPLLAACSAASVQGRVALGERSGALVDRPGRDRSHRSGVHLSGPLCANLEGFSLHGNVRIPARERSQLERLCRYVARPAIASERLSLTEDGKVVYRLRRAYSDGSTSVVFEPLTFLEKLAALIPPPRAYLLVYSGVLAPAAALRSRIVPCSAGFTGKTSLSGCSDRPDGSRKSIRRRLTWAELLKRVFLIDVLQCPCGGRRSLVGLITKPEAIRAILEWMCLPPRAPPIAPAQVAAQYWLDWLDFELSE